MFESLKSGINAAVRAWPVTLFQFGAQILYALAFLFMVVLPVVGIFISVGLDVGNLDYVPEDPTEVLSFLVDHLAGLLVVLLALLLWFTLVLVLALFVYGGTLGTLREAAAQPGTSVDAGVFFRTGRRHFWPLAWLATFVSVLALVPFFLGGAGVLTAVVLGSFAGSGAGGAFLGYFVLVGSILCAVVIMVATVAYWNFASIALVVNDLKAGAAIREGWRFMREHPSSLGFYLLVVLLYGCTVMGLFIIVGVLQFIPVVGVIIALPFQLVNSLVTIFLGIAMSGAFLTYYLGTMGGGTGERNGAPVAEGRESPGFQEPVSDIPSGESASGEPPGRRLPPPVLPLPESDVEWRGGPSEREE